MVEESVFTYAAPALKFGWGAVDEVGHDVRQLGARRVLVVTDPGVRDAGAPQRVTESLVRYGCQVVTYDRVHVEPTDASLRSAVDGARSLGAVDAVVAVGGGSSIDTAKAVALLTTNPGDLVDYLNPPVGGGRAPERPVTPVVAVPTTTGTGSESTAVCVLDVLSLRVKTGISHPRLRPVLAVVDPSLACTQPPQVLACAGFDVLCHALESYTARPYTAFERRAAEQRVPYCGSNPLADVWAERALSLISRSFVDAVRDPSDRRAVTDMAMAATVAGMGFGSAGVHVPHANAYPVAGLVADFRPAGYPGEEPLVPHGMAVAVTAAEAFRFTFAAAPGRHLRAAELLDPDHEAGSPDEHRLPQALSRLAADVGMPGGLGALGFAETDVLALAAGAWKQQRLLELCPRPVTEDDLADIFRRSLGS